MNSIEGMLQSIVDPTVRVKALVNAGVLGTLGAECTSVADAIRDGFIWDNTAEGFEYWHGKWNEAMNVRSQSQFQSRGWTMSVSVRSAIKGAMSTIKEVVL